MQNRTTLTAAGLLAMGSIALTACGGHDHTDNAKPVSTTAATVQAAPTTPTTTSPSKPKPNTKATKDCTPSRDVYVWMRVPGVPDSAQELGDYSACGQQPTFDMIRDTSPTTEGTCTESAWVSDNPGYNPDAEPAERLKKVQVSIGPAC